MRGFVSGGRIAEQERNPEIIEHLMFFGMCCFLVALNCGIFAALKFHPDI
jgi:hypothetical protein